MTDGIFDEEQLRSGTEAHYEDAAYYDQAYRRRKEDLRFYADFAELVGGPVLELGCGTGRVALAMAERGVAVVGVDPMPTMLARAEERVSKAKREVRERVELVRADMRRVRLRRRFPLVVSPFNVFMHLYERRDVERALATVRAHLRRGGRFLFDVRVPQVAELARRSDKIYSGGTLTIPSKGGRYHYRERFEWDPIAQVQMIDLAFVGVDDPADFELTPLAHRQFFPAELEALLHYNGFEVLERFGDFEGGPLGPDSESQIVLCKARR
ncbi:MAG: class I SAM-dependent methyltransferase [Myxococcales bacterium]|nr:class I SAM-dependent methyltransferase [Myxococcales bacterium]